MHGESHKTTCSPTMARYLRCQCWQTSGVGGPEIQASGRHYIGTLAEGYHDFLRADCWQAKLPAMARIG